MPTVLGIHAANHDTGAAIVSNRRGSTEVIAITEARLNRFKHSAKFPLLSITYCLDALGIEGLDGVDIVVFAGGIEDPKVEAETDGERSTQFGRKAAIEQQVVYGDGRRDLAYIAEQSLKIDPKRIMTLPHIDAHAASAYFASPFEDAAIISLDAQTGIFKGSGNKVQVIDRFGYNDPPYNNGIEMPSGHFFGQDLWVPSTGLLYWMLTLRLGFGSFGAGKTMALAAFADKFARRDLLPIKNDRHHDFLILHNEAFDYLRRLAPAFDSKTAPGGVMAIIDEPWINMARQAQEALEEDVLYLARLAKQKTAATKLCYAGGVALSCVANRKLVDSGLFEEVFIQPAASDEGLALGAALHGYHQVLGERERAPMHHAYLGVDYGRSAAVAALAEAGLSGRPATPADVAASLAEGKILGRCVGASEFGPRALGNRSILADPRPNWMKDKVNLEIKHREPFRPFGPSCLAERRTDVFDMPMEGPFMLVAAPVRASHRDVVPAVTHVDGSSRPQTVRSDQNGDYHALIAAFFARTGLPCVLNTSFNDDGEPIIETPMDAVLCFLRTGMDQLLLDGLLVDRPPADKVDLAGLTAARALRIEAGYRDALLRLCDAARIDQLKAQLAKARGG